MTNPSAEPSESSNDPDVPAGLMGYIADAERVLMLTDRIIVLENKLAEARHRYESALHIGRVEEHEEREALRSDLEKRYPKIARAYGRFLHVPGVGSAAHKSVSVLKRVFPSRPAAGTSRLEQEISTAPDEQSALVELTRLKNATEPITDEQDVN